jgi:hypothetical protein
LDVKPVSHLAPVAFVFAALLSASVAAPAIAKEKAPAAPAAKAMDFSKEFRAAAQPVQKALAAKDFAAAAAGLAAVEAAATKPDDKYYAGLFHYQIALANKDQAGQSAGVAAMLASGAAPVEQQGLLNLQLGRDAYFAKDYAKAQTYLNEAVRLGYKPPELLIMSADVNFKQKNYAQGLALAGEGIAAQKAAGQAVPEDWYQRALAGAYNGKLSADTVKWSGELVRAFPTQENWRSALVLYRDAKPLDPQITLDLYRLMRVTKGIAGERDYFDYAAIASERGLPGETKSVVDEGLASGKVPAGSRNLTELRAAAAPKIAADLASLPASEKSAAAAATGKPAMSTGDAYLGYGQDAKAAAMYRLAIQKGGAGVDLDTANTRLGIALARSGDKEGARAAFTAVKGARAELASLWMMYLDTPATAATPA